MKADDPPEVHARVREGLTLVEMIASQVRRDLRVPLPQSELASYGHEGLIRAARSFDPTRGVPFGAWATIRVRGAILDGLRAWGPLPRRVYRTIQSLADADAIEEVLLEEDGARPPANAEEADERLDRYLADMGTALTLGIAGVTRPQREDEEPEPETPEVSLEREQLALAVREAIAELPDQERKIVERHYFADLDLDEAAQEQGLSKSWGSRLHARAIEKIARSLKRRRALP